MKKLLLFSIFFFSILFSQAQAKPRTYLTGTVSDAKTGELLAGASVFLSDPRIGTTTDSTGKYKLENVPAGHTIVEISFAGYKTLVAHLDMVGDTTKDFQLISAVIENEGVTVTGVAGATSIRKAPIPITKINKSELLATASTNIIDALTRQPGVSQLSTGPAISKPIIRGLGYNRLVVINDGVRQEGQQWGDEHGIEIEENSVSRVEILKGPASLIYGSDAIAGVINIVTTAPLQVHTLKGSLLSSFQTNNKQRSFFANLGGNEHGFNWNVWGDYNAAADYKNKYDGRVFNSKFNEHNAGGYLGLNRNWGFTHLIMSTYNQKLGIIEGDRDDRGRFTKLMPGGVEAAAMDEDFESSSPQVPYQHVKHLKFIADNSFRMGRDKLTLNLGWQRNQRFEFGNPDEPKEKSLYFDLTTFNYSGGYHFADKRGWTSSIGINGMAQENRNKGLEVLIPEYKLFDMGAFVYTQKTTGKATISGGVRFDNRNLSTRQLMEGSSIKFKGFQKNFSNFSGSAGLSYAATENFVWKLNLARGFRAPSIPELATNGAHEGTNRYEYGDQNLKSETTFQADLGFEVNSDHILLSASTFYNHIKNFIFYSKLAGSTGGDSLVEVGGDFIPAFKFGQRNATLAGAEVLLDLHPHPLDWLHWQNTISYVRGTFSQPIEGVKNVPFIPATRWISELRAKFLPSGKGLRNLSPSIEVEHTFKQNKPFTPYETETATAGYTLLNAGISVNVVRKNETLFSLFFNATNLGDVAYQNHLSRLKYTALNVATGRRGVFNTGRNFSIKINVPLSIIKP
jgi:iron complex outermembrane receptor protein